MPKVKSGPLKTGSRAIPSLKFSSCNVNDNGESILYDYTDSSSGSQHASMYQETFTKIHKNESQGISIKTTTLDQFCRSNSVHKIDFLKIDTEGNELNVLAGAEDLLKNSAIRQIYFEFNEMNIASRVFMKDFMDLLQAYNIFRVLPHGLLPIDNRPLYSELFGYQNIFCIPKD